MFLKNKPSHKHFYILWLSLQYFSLSLQCKTDYNHDSASFPSCGDSKAVSEK